jgi:preprotein translocase subunit SecE
MADEEKSGQGFVQRVSSWPKRMKNYFGELQNEMRRVTWPNWKQVRATTMVVIVAVFAFSAYFYIVDRVFAAIVGRILGTVGK